jgi:hypothetical protein
MLNNAGIPGALGPLNEIRAEEGDFTFAELFPAAVAKRNGMSPPATPEQKFRQ